MENRTLTHKPILELLTIVIILWAGNYGLYGRWLSGLVLCAVMLPMGATYLALRATLRSFFHKSKQSMAKAAAVMLFLFVAVPLVCYFLVYVLYPQIGIVLYRPDVSFKQVVFLKNIGSSFMTLFFFSLTSVWVETAQQERQRQQLALEEAKAVMEDLRYRLQLRDIMPHFVGAIMSTAIGRSMMGKGKDHHEIIIKFTQVMRYVLDQDEQGQQTTTLGTEWTHIRALVDVLQWKYGDHKVGVAMEGRFNGEVWVVSMAMLTLVENAIKYTDFETDRALELALIFSEEGFRFSCRNRYNARRRSQQQGSRFGLRHLRRRLYCSPLDMQLCVTESDGYFIATLNNTYNHGKHQIYRSNSG